MQVSISWIRLPTRENRSRALRDHLRITFERQMTGSMKSGKPTTRTTSVESIPFAAAVQTMNPTEMAISNGA